MIGVNGSWIFLILIIIGVVVAVVGGVIAIVLVTVTQSNKHSERLQKLSEIEYTQILNSGGGVRGSLTTFGNDGMNMGTYSSAPVTKFLVVYKDGQQEIVSVQDNSRLCREYLARLKK